MCRKEVPKFFIPEINDTFTDIIRKNNKEVFA